MEKLLDFFVPNHYELNFIVDKTQKLLTGTAIIKGDAKTNTIKLHAKYLDISSVTIDDQPADFTINEDVMIIESSQTGNLVVKITYTHQITSDLQGVYLSTYEYDGHTETIVSTQFEPHYARQCFPCVDEPAAKATFDLSIATNPSDTILSNMPVKTQSNDTTTFETTPKMSTYLLAFVIGKFKKHEATTSNDIRVTTYAPLTQPNENLTYATDFAIKSLDFFNDLFKTPYPLPKLDQVAIPDFEFGAMENWGLVTFREQALLCNQNSSLDQKLFVATVIAHELSHMWFGDLVTMHWWDELWLNESFASLIETYAVDKIDPSLGAWNNFYSGTVVPALRRDCLPGVQPVKCEVKNPADISTIFDGAIVYAKGARLMLMLMRLMGEDAFFAGLADYFTKHAYQNTTANDLWDSFTPHADFDIKEFMTPWIVQPGYPVLELQDQHRFLITESSSEPNYTYPIPEVKDDLSGHYIINLQNDQFQTALRNFNTLALEQKLRLLLDRQLLSKTPIVASADLIPLLTQVTTETEFVIWDALALIVADLKIFFLPDSAPEQHFKNFVKSLAQVQFDRLGLTTLDNEPENDTKLRPIILSFMAYSEDLDYQALIISHFENIPIAEIDPNIRPVILPALTKLNVKDQINDQFTHQNLTKLYRTSSDPELRSDLLAALAAIKNPDILTILLPLLKDDTIRPGDRIIFFVRLLRNSIAIPLVINWLFENWDWISQTEGEKTTPDYPRYTANVIRTTSDFVKFKDFFEPKLGEPALTRTLEIAFTEIQARLDLIATDGPAVLSILPFTSQE